MDSEYILSGEVWNKLHDMGVIGDDYPINEARVMVVQNDYVYLEVKLVISRQQLIDLITLSAPQDGPPEGYRVEGDDGHIGYFPALNGEDDGYEDDPVYEDESSLDLP